MPLPTIRIGKLLIVIRLLIFDLTLKLNGKTVKVLETLNTNTLGESFSINGRHILMWSIKI